MHSRTSPVPSSAGIWLGSIVDVAVRATTGSAIDGAGAAAGGADAEFASVARESICGSIARVGGACSAVLSLVMGAVSAAIGAAVWLGVDALGHSAGAGGG